MDGERIDVVLRPRQWATEWFATAWGWYLLGKEDEAAGDERAERCFELSRQWIDATLRVLYDVPAFQYWKTKQSIAAL